MSAPSDSTLSRRERERQRRRRAMLRAARSVFAEQGYDRATLDEIAERAEFGKGTLYNYFEGGKEEMLFAVLEEIHDDICDLIRSVFASEEAQERPLRASFHAFVKAYFDFSQEHEDLFMILFKEAHRQTFSADDERAAFFRAQRERMAQALIPTLEDAMERGEIQPLPPDSVAHMLLANVNGIVVHRCIADQKENCCEDSIVHDPEQVARFLTSMLFDGLALSPSTVSSASASSSNE